MLSNSAVTFNVENVNLLSNPNVKPENGVAYIKKMCLEMEHWFEMGYDKIFKCFIYFDF